MSDTSRGSVLISGASIAGPALAYWLDRYGFEVTVVERAPEIRGGGYAIDVRGTALEVVRRMGVLPRLREAHLDTRSITFLAPDGEVITTMAPDALNGGAGQDVELPRGRLTEVLAEAVGDDVEFRFGDSIASLDQHEHGVDVVFRSGQRRTFDLVVGADGLHSNTRALAFGPEERFHHYLGFCYAGFTMRGDFDLSRGGTIWNAPGRSAVLYAMGDTGTVYGFLSFALPEPPFTAFRDPAAQRDLVASMFADDGWQLPHMIDAMHASPDLFFDIASQIHLPSWSAGRVALVGDAAYAPSFLTGQGTSLALVGAYMLAGALATEPDHETAFAAYEQGIREYVRLNQAIVTAGKADLIPGTEAELTQRNAALRTRAVLPPPEERPEYTALVLPSFTAAA
jgi:2-polyprenyl-6-methoxyphenol hydroxylase-like FAD-dependent oxidoreductase